MSVIGLMGHHVDWPDGKENAPVYVDLGLSPGEILDAKYISTQLKKAGLRRLGIMFDADTNPKGRYSSLRNLCVEYFPNLPDEIDADGVCVEHDGMRFGIWIMPDNESEGYLESFLKYLVRPEGTAVWDHAVQCVANARVMGATCKDVHVPKACLYTWLAWQDEPGQSPGRALTQKILDPHGPHAESFIQWFCRLYEIKRTSQPAGQSALQPSA